MYNAFFGFHEKPFKLVPNPDYLYLSKSHEDALAHLAYAVDQGDGFVVIIGEVGTGKTTLCRNFLEQLDTNTESAYIFNPRLDSTQLLSSICAEYGIKIIGKQDVKELLDKLNTYLIAQHAMDRKVVLLIDESQGLSVKSLEMVRLISNLETTRSKLLQIILVGQPELADKLASHELRQLAQRISLNCQLLPLTASETRGYIRHRVNIAAIRPLDIFSDKSCQLAFEFACGVPRLINIVCDRALLSAYSQNQSNVDGTIMQAVIAELGRRIPEIKPRKLPLRIIWLTLLVVGLLAVGIWGILGTGMFSRAAPHSEGPKAAEATPAVRVYKVPVDTTRTQPGAKSLEIADKPISNSAGEWMTDPSSELQFIIASTDRHASRLRSLSLLFGMWQKPQPNAYQIPSTLADQEFFEMAARRNGMRSYKIVDDWLLVKRINLPAIVGLKKPQSEEIIYLSLIGWTDRQVRLVGDQLDKIIIIDMDTLRSYLHGSAYILWKNMLGYDAIIGQWSEPGSLIKVKELLVQLGYEDVGPDSEYDSAMRKAILDFQTQHRLKVDGLVGPLTKIMLIREAGGIDIPLLNQSIGDGA